MVSPWTTERDALLTEMHGRPDEPSFRVMAEAINKKCGTVLTRNACISRAHRIHLAKRMPSNQSTFNKQTVGRKQRQPPKARQRYSPESKRMVTIFESREVLELHCAEVEPRGLTLQELEPNDCRWAYGDASITFCAHPKMEGSSYCVPHFFLSRRRMS